MKPYDFYTLMLGTLTICLWSAIALMHWFGMTSKAALLAVSPDLVASLRPEYWTVPLTYIGGLTVGFLPAPCFISPCARSPIGAKDEDWRGRLSLNDFRQIYLQKDPWLRPIAFRIGINRHPTPVDNPVWRDHRGCCLTAVIVIRSGKTVMMHVCNVSMTVISRSSFQMRT
jgi:hypothetical protein